MPEYIERGKLLQDIEESVVFTAKSGQPSLEIRGANKITARIMAAPIVDVVEVVRCKDCEYSRKFVNWNKREYCGCIFNGEIYEVDSMHYCSHGAKMDGKGEGE